MLDADLRLQRSVYQPEVGGNIKLSRAEATIPIQGAPSPSSERPVATVADEVKQAFDALRAKQDAQTNTLVRHPSIHLEDPQQV